jgi:hypothetical protein
MTPAVIAGARRGRSLFLSFSKHSLSSASIHHQQAFIICKHSMQSRVKETVILTVPLVEEAFTRLA